MSSRRLPVRRSRPRAHRFGAPLIRAATTALILSPAYAADRVWVNPAGGNYNDPANWDNFPFGGVPNSTDNIVFNLSSTYGVSLPIVLDSYNAIGYVRGGSVTFSQPFGGNFHFTTGLIVGQSAGQNATFSNGALTTVYGGNTILGDGAGSTGRVSVNGPFYPDQLTVGNAGIGYFDTGASFNTAAVNIATFGAQPGSQGFGNITTAFGAPDLRVGAGGSGIIDVASGAVLFSGQASVGGTTGSGRVTLAGMDYWEVTNTLTLGGTGATGQLVMNGGELRNRDLLVVRALGRLDVNTNARAMVGHTLNIQGGLVRAATASAGIDVGRDIDPSHPLPPAAVLVGDDVNGSLNISGGGRLETVTNGFLGLRSGITGAVSIQGAASQWNTGGADVYVGFSGRATLDVGSGGLLSNRDGHVGFNFTSSGVATISNASWVNSGSLTVGELGIGRLTVTNGAGVSNTFGAIAPNPGAIGIVTLGGAASSGAPAQWFNTGMLTIGNSSFSGNATLQVFTGGEVDATAGLTLNTTGSIQVLGGVLNTRSVQLNGGSFARSGGVVVINSPYDLSGLPAAGFYVGTTGSGVLDVPANVTVSNTGAAFVGFGAGSTGTASVHGALATFSNTSFLSVGEDGTGRLDVFDGGAVSAGSVFIGYGAAANGRIRVTGANSTLTSSFLSMSTLGGRAELDVNTGGLVRVAGPAEVRQNGVFELGFGGGGKFLADSLIVTGGAVYRTGGLLAISTTDNSASEGVHIGLSGGAGSLTVQAAGLLSTPGIGRIASQAGSTGNATVDGLSSLWTVGEFDVGSAGNGALLVDHSGRVVSADAYVGFNTAATGNATVRNQASWVADTLYVGYAGVGRVTVSNGATLETLNAAIGLSDSGDGRVSVGGLGGTIGSVWTNRGAIDVGGISGAQAALNVSTDGTLYTGSLRIAPGRIVTNVGGTLNAGTFRNDGGTYNQSSGVTNTGPVTNNGTLSLGGKTFTAGISGTGSVFLSGVLHSDHIRQTTLLADQPTSLMILRSNGGPDGASRLVNLNLGADPFTGGAVGQLDLANNGLVLDYPSSDPDPVVTIRSWIRSGRNGGAWNGPGIISTPASANPDDFTVGYAPASGVLGPSGGTFLNQPADGTAILIRYTLMGDATLDGKVTFNDLVQLAQNYNTNLFFTTSYWWYNGDFTDDGVVDFNDLVRLAQHYNMALPSEPIPGSPAGFDQDLARAFAAVPEPQSIVALVVCGCIAGRRRRGD